MVQENRCAPRESRGAAQSNIKIRCSLLPCYGNNHVVSACTGRINILPGYLRCHISSYSFTLTVQYFINALHLTDFHFVILPVFYRHIISVLTHIAISRTDDLSFVDQFFQSVCAPSGNTRDGKDRCEQFCRDAQHRIDKSAVKVYVCADGLEQVSALCDQL